jgi:hypothetical protein
MPMDLQELEKAKRRLLAAVPPGKVMGSGRLLDTVEAKKPQIDGDTLRYAYWVLVGSGELVRSPGGISKPATRPPG